MDDFGKEFKSFKKMWWAALICTLLMGAGSVAGTIWLIVWAVNKFTAS